MTTIKSLLIKIGADVTGLEAGLKKAQSYVESHAATFRTTGKAITIAGAAITGTVGLMMKSYIEAGDALEEMSQRTGMSTTTLSELKYMASLCGADLGEVELAVKKMSSSLVDAATKGGPAADALSLLGLKAQDLIKLSPEQQFDKIASAIAGLENPTLRANAAQDLFGRSGTKLLPIFAGGAAGLDAMKKKAHELGLVLDTEAAAKAGLLDSALKTLKGSLTGIGNTVAQTLAPAITGLAEKVTGVIVKIKEWMTAHPGLSGAIVKVVTAMGLLMTAIGPVLIVLPTLIGSLKMLGLAKLALLGPIGLVTAALAGTVVFFLAYKDAIDKADEADKRFVDANIKLGNKLYELVKNGDMAIDTYYKLWDQFEGNAAAMAMFIEKGKAGKEAQEGLVKIGKEHRAVIAEQKQALLDKADAEMKAMLASEAAKKQIEAIITARRQMTDEIAKATMKEREYARSAITTAYEEREAAIGKEITDEKARDALLLQAAQSRNVQLAALEKSFRDEDLQAKIDFAMMVADQEDQQTVDRLEALKAFAVQKQAIQDGINQMTMTELQYKLWAIEQERAAEALRITESTQWNAAEQEELLKALDEFYKQKKKKAEADAKGWTELVENTKGAIMGILGTLFSTTLDAFKTWGEGGGSILTTLGEAFKSTVNTALGALRDLVTGMLLASMKEILMAKAVAIANVIKSVMQSIPFPFNLALVGGAIAGVAALFSKIKLAEGGIVTGPTLAMIGERGPEAVIPLDRPGALAFAGAGVTLRQQNYFYGSINNAGDLDEISRRLAERTIRAISKGRR